MRVMIASLQAFVWVICLFVLEFGWGFGTSRGRGPPQIWWTYNHTNQLSLEQNLIAKLAARFQPPATCCLISE